MKAKRYVLDFDDLVHLIKPGHIHVLVNHDMPDIEIMIDPQDVVSDLDEAIQKLENAWERQE